VPAVKSRQVLPHQLKCPEVRAFLDRLRKGLPRWVHRDLPPPSLRCALRALRSGGGSLLWTTWTIRNDDAQVGHQTTHQQKTTDSGRHRQPPSAAVRQLSIAIMARRRGADNDAPCRSRNAGPKWRNTSATSNPSRATGTALQVGTRSGTPGVMSRSDSSGLAVAQTLLVAIMRYLAVVLRLR